MHKKSICFIFSLAAAGFLFFGNPVTAVAAGKLDTETSGVTSILSSGQLTDDEYISLANQAKGAFMGYTNIGIADVETGNLNVRAAGSKESKLVGKLPKDAACEVLDFTEDGWAHITSGEVEGYVSTDYLLTGPDARVKAKGLVSTVAVANTDGLNIRENPDTTAPVVSQILKGEELEFVEKLDNGWVKVSIDGDEAYVKEEFVEISDSLPTAVTMTELLYGQGVSDIRVEICEYAKQFIGNPYVWGGTSLTKGADCSGFVMSVFKKYGVKLSHSSRAQANEGTKISISELKPGDLIFYSNGSSINHVAIYIGGGQIVHASSPKTGIRINKYNYRNPVKAVRVLYD
ncbi:MAG: C40 family peptidase [Lachnospiraceae bacterium]|nr:C40 family peptidase [Lachnospiraceae bacterium]